MEFNVVVPFTKTQVLLNKRIAGNGEIYTFYIDTKLFKTAYLFYSFTNFSATNNANLKVYSVIGGKKFLLKEITTASELIGNELISFVGETLYIEVQAFADVNVFIAFKFFV